MKKVQLLTLLSLLLSLTLAGQGLALDKGDLAPDFELLSIEGKKVRLSDFKGQQIVLKLATTWCPDCKQQSEEIDRASAYLKENNVAVVEVFVKDDKDAVREYAANQRYRMPHVALMDDGQAYQAYQVYLIPRTLLIDENFRIQRDGNLIYRRKLIKALEKTSLESSSSAGLTVRNSDLLVKKQNR